MYTAVLSFILLKFDFVCILIEHILYNETISYILGILLNCIAIIILIRRSSRIFTPKLKICSNHMTVFSFQLFIFNSIEIDMIENIKTTYNRELKDKRFKLDSVIIDFKCYGRTCRVALKKEDYTNFLSSNRSILERLDLNHRI